MKFFKFSVKQLIATVIGVALYLLLSYFLSFQILPDIYLAFQYAIVGFFAAVFGPISGFVIGLAGQVFTDLSFNAGIWWSWCIASAFVGFGSGFLLKPGRIEEGWFSIKDVIRFIVGSLAVYAVSWGAIAPGLDILIYREPADMVFTHALVTGVVNYIATVIFGTLLLYLYAGTRKVSGDPD